MGLIDKCGKVYRLDAAVTCNRPENHYGLHRDKVLPDKTSRSWGENECAAPATEPAGTFTVKAWYWSGAYEEIPGVDAGNALAYLAEMRDNENVRAAEIHSADGALASGFTSDGTRALDTADKRG